MEHMHLPPSRNRDGLRYLRFTSPPCTSGMRGLAKHDTE